MKNTIISIATMLSVIPAASFAQHSARTSMYLQAAPPTATPLFFNGDTDINTCSIPAMPIEWGMDTAWLWDVIVVRGVNWIGKDILSNGVGRVSFQPSDLVDEAGNLSAEQKKWLQNRLNVMAMSGAKNINLNCDHEVLMNKDTYPNADQNYANYNGKPYEWYRVIKATIKYCRDRGFNVVSVSPFNEPDFTDWKEGTQADFKEIARLITTDPELEGIRICAGNTLNCDQAMSWYNASKPYVTIGNTHQLAGSFDNYANFWTTVKNDGNFGTADELHNTMEAFVGAHYGMNGGIWWGFESITRGEYCKASSSGKEIGYAESRGTWTAAAVYKRDNGRIDAFLGGSERQANTNTFNLVSTNRPSYFEGYGPVYNYPHTVPGGTGYQKGQTNAERIVQIHHGKDVPLMPIESGKTYTIYNKNGLKALQPYNNTVGNSIEQRGLPYKKTPYEYQKWVITSVSPTIGGDYSFFNISSALHTNAYISVNDDWNFDVNAAVKLLPGVTSEKAQWYFEYAGEGDWYIRNRWTGLYLDIDGGSNQAGKTAVMNTYTGKASQRWRITDVDITSIDKVAPKTPADVKAKRLTSAIRLTWTANTDTDIKSYLVRRSEAGKNEWDVIGRMITTPTFLDNEVIADQAYDYEVCAVDMAQNVSVAATLTVSGKTPKGIVARYGFEDNIDDASDNWLDAVSYNTPTYNTTTPKEGTKRIYINAPNKDYLRLPAGIANSKTMTVATWVYNNSSGSWARIFDFGNGEDSYMFLSPTNGSEMRFAIKANGTEQYLATTKLANFKWAHVAVTISDDAVTLYVNGEAVATTKDITWRPTDVRPVMNYIGKSQFEGDNYLKAYLDDFRVYNYSLSASDIKTVMDGGEVTPPVEGLPGDANDDGKVDKADADAVIAYYLGQSSDINIENADVNEDGKITVDDANIIVNMIIR
ncbi:MAG: RICIN domain-containing protein [Prevotella sp.]|nr:RICIN domain-containing protein [Candidatus Prevotella equi]